MDDGAGSCLQGSSDICLCRDRWFELTSQVDGDTATFLSGAAALAASRRAYFRVCFDVYVLGTYCSVISVNDVVVGVDGVDDQAGERGHGPNLASPWIRLCGVGKQKLDLGMMEISNNDAAKRFPKLLNVRILSQNCWSIQIVALELFSLWLLLAMHGSIHIPNDLEACYYAMINLPWPCCQARPVVVYEIRIPCVNMFTKAAQMCQRLDSIVVGDICIFVELDVVHTTMETR